MSGSTSLEAPPASPVDIGMMLEKIRSGHEEIERLEKLVVEELKTEETSPMKQLLQGHRLRSLAKSIVLKSEKLVETYGKIGGDIAPLRFQTPWTDMPSAFSSRFQTPWTDVSSAFSSRLEEIVEYHRTHTCAPPLGDSDYESLSKGEPVTVEECLGSYLDLHDISESGDGCNKNSLKRSMGWDGRPIPYWLDKLGLGKEYKCEICRNESYAGKRAFDRHFKEERHLRGLVCFGLSGRRHAPPQRRDQGTEWKAPAGVAIPPPDIRGALEAIVGSLLGEGLEFQRKIVDHYREVEGFEFLKSGDVHHEFYKHRLAEQRAHAPDSEGAAGASCRHDDCLEGLPNAEKLHGVTSVEEAREILGMPKRGHSVRQLQVTAMIKVCY
ncbi:unnamed protein product [Microthlaspi erraticum]|uniref:SURP motif domain-containing protein n=1 Tax=Microthlaspi erraticum TaxID=1685480 RepID=A0A6D2JAJ9_9BRAS|nr:unnamed protein product [Microthlaspi erraticum]